MTRRELAATLLAWMLIALPNALTGVVAIFAIDIAKGLQVGVASIGLASGIALLGSAAIAHVLSPRLRTDHLRFELVGIMSITTLGLSFVCLAATVWLFAIGLTLMGIAAVAAEAASNSVVRRVVGRENWSRSTGLKQTAVPAAGLTVAFVVAAFGASLDWRAITWSLAAVALLGTLVAASVPLAGVSSTGAATDGIAQSVRAPLSPARQLSMYAFLLGVAGSALGLFMPAFLRSEANISISMIGAMSFVGGAITILLRIIWPRVAELWLGPSRVLTTLAGGGALGATLLLATTSASLAWIASAVLASTIACWHSLAALVLLRSVPPQLLGRASSRVATAFTFGGSVGGSGLGQILRMTNFDLLWVTCAAIALVAIWPAVRLPPFKSELEEEVKVEHY